MVDIHKILRNSKFDPLNRFSSTIGKELEEYKVQIKRLQKSYEFIVDKNEKTDTDRFILSEGKRMIDQGINAVKYIISHDYLGIIERSMNRKEVCIGRCDQGNLRKCSNGFEIASIKNMSYNLVEEDLYKYIKRVQRKNNDIDEEELIKKFVYSSHLSFNSLDYLRGLCSYPRDFFRIWEKYYNMNLKRTNEEYLELLKKSMNYENKSFIM